MTTIRHVVSVMRPTSAVGTVGQRQGQDTVIVPSWPCSIEPLSGREIIQARTAFAEATHKVDGVGDPSNRLAERDYLTGGSIGSRKLAIAFISDKHQNGVQLSLICGERTGG